MRPADSARHLYIDFDGFFAGVEECITPAIRGRPIGVIPTDTLHTCCIAANSTAKRFGVKTGMMVKEAQRLCPDIVFVRQHPDMYRRAHLMLVNMIERHMPVDAVCSIDEITTRLDRRLAADPRDLALSIKRDIKKRMGPFLTASIGVGPNRSLAKIACKLGKPNGFTLITPQDLPAKLLPLALIDIPGIGKRTETRLMAADIHDVAGLWRTSPKQLRALWGNVAGERLWYTLHGYELEPRYTRRSMFSHSRVLAPELRDPARAGSCIHFLAFKAAFRMRRNGFAAGRAFVGLRTKGSRLQTDMTLPDVGDAPGCLRAVDLLWQRLRNVLGEGDSIIRCAVGFTDLCALDAQQPDMFDARHDRARCERVTRAMDLLNYKYGRIVVCMGPCSQPPGGYAGGKIAFSHLPDEEDFWDVRPGTQA